MSRMLSALHVVTPLGLGAHFIVCDRATSVMIYGVTIGIVRSVIAYDLSDAIERAGSPSDSPEWRRSPPSGQHRNRADDQSAGE